MNTIHIPNLMPFSMMLYSPQPKLHIYLNHHIQRKIENIFVIQMYLYSKPDAIFHDVVFAPTNISNIFVLRMYSYLINDNKLKPSYSKSLSWECKWGWNFPSIITKTKKNMYIFSPRLYLWVLWYDSVWFIFFFILCVFVKNVVFAPTIISNIFVLRMYSYLNDYYSYSKPDAIFHDVVFAPT